MTPTRLAQRCSLTLLTLTAGAARAGEPRIAHVDADATAKVRAAPGL